MTSTYVHIQSKLVHDVVVKEVLDDLVTVLQDRWGCRLFVHLITPTWERKRLHFPAFAMDFLHHEGKVNRLLPPHSPLMYM
eukprot:NODE_1944_length_802_cov_88.399734_g1540_i0.p1 GENE.NODE_1944_length_802_cov_88.399734_g1540_i0~~NODE_1944_length_802_cov_88.399734_g1540_i0.p1  ORF type:complete len:81 (+),score=18.66 NODE_1944_length_802_cov_88.399734_g1540_i0:43-285(+)